MLKKFILSSKNIHKDAFVWNAYSAMLNSFQMTLLLVFLTRFGNDKESSIFVMAYAIANLLLHIGKFGIRQFQVTDTNEKYSYKEYELLRRILVFAMIVITVLYVCVQSVRGAYAWDKSLLIIVICGMRAIEAYEDVMHGRLQQLGRLDIGSKILSIRLTIYVILFATMYVALKNVLLVATISLIIQIIIAIVLNSMAKAELNVADIYSKQNIKTMFIDVLPLGAAMFVNIYISNSPKYIIDEIVSDAVQTRFNIIFMPVFVVAMLAGFIYQPLVKKMGNLWNQGEVKAVNNQVFKISIATLVIVLAATGAAYLLGVPALELVYGVDLDNYRTELVLLTFTGGIIALLNILIILITMVRKQKYLLYGYVVIALIILLSGKQILIRFDIIGLCIMFMLSLICLLVYFVSVYAIEVKKKRG